MASIQRRPNGSWRARYRDADGKEHARHFKYKDKPSDPENSAQAWLDEVTAAKVTGLFLDPRAGEVSFESFFDEWQGRQIWSPSTRKSAKNAVKHSTFRGMSVAQIRKSHVEASVKAMHDKGLAASTIKLNMRFVKMVFTAAIHDRLIAHDPTGGVKLPKVQRSEGIVIPTVEEVGELVNAAEHPMKLLVALCAFAGLRRGEAIAVQYGDFDFEARTLKVDRQVREAEVGGSEFEAPKHGSKREVFVPQGLLELVNQHVEHLGVRGKDKWLFSATANGPTRSYLDPQWRDLRASVGQADLKLHDLRHFYASGLIAAHCDVVTVQKAMGHASPAITLNTYSHLWETAEDLTRGAAAALMADANIAGV